MYGPKNSPVAAAAVNLVCSRLPQSEIGAVEGLTRLPMFRSGCVTAPGIGGLYFHARE